MGFLNTKHKFLISQLRVDTPNLVSANEFRRFCLSWNNGLVTVRSGGFNGPVLLEWQDTNPKFPVTHIGIRTAWGATGKWKLYQGQNKGGARQPAKSTVLPAAG